ncbi:MAG: hypothetical protein PVF96_02970 [Candidatus Bathyarchaeota archaeon]
MGRTVSSYRRALEKEIKLWSGFRKTLRSEDLFAFDEMMKICRIYASAGGMATRPILIEAMFMSILLGQQKEILKIAEKLGQLERLLRQAQIN